MNTMYTKNGAIKPRKSIVIYKNGKQIICPTHEMLIADGWAVYTKPEPTAEELFERAKSELKQSIINYDSSNAVNNFFMGDMPMWLDKGTRTGLMLRFQSEQAIGKENTTLWYGTHSFTLPIATAIQMLFAIEAYASACYDNTQKHLANVEELTLAKDVESYDYTIGYPEQLHFG